MDNLKNKNIKAPEKSKGALENDIWNDVGFDEVRAYILRESAKQTPERILRNELLAIKYQMQDYINDDKIDKEMRVIDFVKLYLKILNITLKQLADVFEMKDSNLYKYLKGDRKLNPDIVFKLSSFSHTQPELWYYVQTKNELCELYKEKDNLNKYKKYDYENFALPNL